jgi:ABC-type transport system involved in cytochrome c biogenesis permease subunit
MSNSTLLEPRTAGAVRPRSPRVESDAAAPSTVRSFAQALASLKLTVWLIGMTIFLVLAGTLAQVKLSSWQVVDEYFRTFIAWIDFQLFFPAAFFPNRPAVSGGFYFPGGWTLGTLLAANLFAAHAVRFRVLARGWRLVAGLALIAAGVLITWLVVAGGSAGDGLQATPSFGWSTIWNLFLLGLAVASVASLTAGFLLNGERRRPRRMVVIGGILLLSLFGWLLAQGDAARLDDSSLRILWQLGKGTAAGMVLLAGCAVLFHKRAGVVLLHGGIGLLMLNELLVGVTAVEGKMHIAEGQTVNFVEDLRRLELAVVDQSNSKKDDVVVVPQSRLTDGKVIRHQDLPFDIRVDAFLKNAVLRQTAPNENNPATAGLGLQWMARESRPASGTDASGKVDQSAAYVTFLDKQNARPLGTHLVSLVQTAQELPEKVTVADKAYKVYLRFKRTYKPYALTLVDVRKDDYLGTDTPRNYSSDVQLRDEANGVDREVRIWMNNPLRFAGETFYQSGYFRDPETGLESTTLQVVTNTGWMIPYVACMIVALGLLTHFSIVLLRFLRRQERAVIDSESVAGSAKLTNGIRPSRTWRAWALPACVVLLLAGWVASKAHVPTAADGDFDLYEFGKLPIVYQGRAKPVDTLARNTLRILSGRQTFVDEQGQRQPAIRWLLDVMARPDAAARHKVFRIEHPEVLQTMGLEARDGFRYSYSELEPRLDGLTKQAELARTLEQNRLTVYQKKVLELDRKLGLYDLLVQSFAKPAIRSNPEHAAVDVYAALQQQRLLAKRMPPLIVPPQTAEADWTTYSAAALEEARRRAVDTSSSDSPLGELTAMRVAYAAGDAATFNAAVTGYRSRLSANPPARVDLAKIDFEAFFNHFEPFYHASVLYVIAFVLTAVSWLGWGRSLRRSAFWLVVLTFVVHSLALVGRIYISGRPPVTNLYSSAVLIGWGCVLLGIVLECVYRMGTGLVVSTVAGFATLLIAHFLAGDGDTFAVLQAVLDTQFWLATHVVCITLGYATTYVAGLLGILYVARGVLTPTLRPAAGKELARMIYGTLCFAIFFSFVGTVLGGLWADDSWGRFWGWDPKENGALMIVMWNALALHARWGGMVKERGLALLAVAGNIVVSWSWFGVNELGIGLHSYGFTEGVLLTLGLFVASQLLIIALGSLPQHWWWSVRRQRTAPAAD